MVTASKSSNEDESYLLLQGNDAKTIHIFSVIDGRASDPSQNQLSIAATTHELKFDVRFASGYVQDPVIVVRPIDD